MSLAVDLDKFAASAIAKVERTRRGVCLKLFGAIIRDTPVLTGRLRGNWQTSLASPLLGELPLRPEAAAVGEMMVAVQSMHGDVPIFFRNNLPYAARIEYDGWSHTKAPAGMVRKNVAQVMRLVAEAVREGRL